jgi:hypothetical protein
MEPPELTNFGSLVRFAVELEGATAAFYATAVGLLGSGRAAELARQLAIQHETRRDLLVRTRQQKLNEMVLEPITGLDGTRYVFDATAAGPRELLPKAMALEEVAERLYEESSIVAKSLLTEAARTFRKLADENVRNLAAIRESF